MLVSSAHGNAILVDRRCLQASGGGARTYFRRILRNLGRSLAEVIRRPCNAESQLKHITSCILGRHTSLPIVIATLKVRPPVFTAGLTRHGVRIDPNPGNAIQPWLHPAYRILMQHRINHIFKRSTP